VTRDLAIDLGSANTLVFARGRGIVLTEPTVIAVNERTGEVLAVGEEAWATAGRGEDGVVSFRPMRRGAVSDYALTERMLELMMRRVGASRFLRPRVLVCVQSWITMVERRAVEEAALEAGARQVWLIDEPIAAAIGSDLPIDEPTGNYIVDVGGGTTEAAVISMGEIVASRSTPVGGFDFDDAIQRHIRVEHGMSVGPRTSEALKVAIGSAAPLDEEVQAEVRGRDIESGSPRVVVVTSEEIRRALEALTRAVVEGVRGALADTPPELAHDVLDRGIHLTGGGALLRGLDRRISAETDIPVHVGERPLETVCVGAGLALEALDRLRDRGLVGAPDRSRR
jgi:rod shape-determining protein MreB